jgi:membrane-anchored protein YejM (alkaline phosphatase superfamily)
MIFWDRWGKVRLKIGQRGIRNATIILVIALLLMSMIMVYEAANYGHQVKWKFSSVPILTPMISTPRTR